MSGCFNTELLIIFIRKPYRVSPSANTQVTLNEASETACILSSSTRDQEANIMKNKIKGLLSTSLSAWMMNSAPSSRFDEDYSEWIYIYVKEKMSGMRLSRR
jgi:hypothetical protein